MNAYLLNRALGSITPSTFHVAQTTRLVQHLEPAPGIRFSSRKKLRSPGRPDDGLGIGQEYDEVPAHQSGANVLAIDQYDGRL